MKILRDGSKLGQEDMRNMLNVLGLRNSEGLKTLVFGVGGSGINTLNNFSTNVGGVEIVVASGDQRKLDKSALKNKIFLGKENGEGVRRVVAGFDPSVGRILAEENISKIEKYLNGVNLLIITGGMSGSMATGAIPVVIKRAKEMGIPTIAVISSPFTTEGQMRAELANEGVEKIKNVVDAMILYDSKYASEAAKAKQTKNILEELDVAVCGIINKLIDFTYNNQ
ncbi:MAG: hypothetical protein LBS34_00810 [Rickettsiales bacterium]|jgi:cell division protein FtsZ|nr:hypothetical protein [Rickettsiales bacterium]